MLRNRKDASCSVCQAVSSCLQSLWGSKIDPMVRAILLLSSPFTSLSHQAQGTRTRRAFSWQSQATVT